MKTKFIATVVSLFVFVSLSQALDDGKAVPSGQSSILIVNGKYITTDAVYKGMISAYPKQTQEVVNGLVNSILINDEASRLNIKNTPEEVKAKISELGLATEPNENIFNSISTSLLAEKILTAQFKFTATSAEVTAYFNENKEKLGQPEKLHLRHIYMASENGINEVLLSIKAGADFAKTAQTKSEDKTTSIKGGELGFFSKGMLAPNIEKIVFLLKTGEVSQPIKVDNGYHIIQLVEKTPEVVAKLDKKMKEKVSKLLVFNKLQSEMPNWLDGLVKNSIIKKP